MFDLCYRVDMTFGGRFLKISGVVLLGVAFWIGNAGFGIPPVNAQESLSPPLGEYQDTFWVGTVLTAEEVSTPQGTFQAVTLEIENGKNQTQVVEINHGENVSIREEQKVEPGDKVVVIQSENPQGVTYSIIDHYRLPGLGLITLLFLGLAVLLGRRKALMSVLGLIVSIGVLIYFILPQIATGSNPLLISFVGAVFIAVCSLSLAHGFEQRTRIALVSTLITLGLSALLSMGFVSLARLTGLGSDDALYLTFGPLEHVNLKGILLGGILIGALGVLDDITTAQAAAVDEIRKANPKLSFHELYRRGLSVGREHIASLINTLVLAYAGASLPLFLLLTSDRSQPLWMILNSEFLGEEIVRTLVGSTTLLLAVPITTGLAAYRLSRG